MIAIAETIGETAAVPSDGMIDVTETTMIGVVVGTITIDATQIDAGAVQAMTEIIGVHQTDLVATGDNVIVNAGKAHRRIVAAMIGGANATTAADQPSSLIRRHERKTSSALFSLQPNSSAPLRAASSRLRISFKARQLCWLPALTESCTLVSCHLATLPSPWLN